MLRIIAYGFASLLFSVASLDSSAHDGPHDDMPAPKYKVDELSHRGGVHINISGQTILVELSLTQSALIDKDRNPLQANQKQLVQKAVNLLPDLQNWLEIDGKIACQQTYQSHSYHEKHRALRPGLEKLEPKDREAFIQTFQSLAATYRISCDRSVNNTDLKFQTKMFQQAPHLRKLHFHVQSQNVKRLWVLSQDEKIGL